MSKKVIKKRDKKIRSVNQTSLKGKYRSHVKKKNLLKDLKGSSLEELNKEIGIRRKQLKVLDPEQKEIAKQQLHHLKKLKKKMIGKKSEMKKDK